MKYKKKPVVIEAVRLNGNKVSENTPWIEEAFKKAKVYLDDHNIVKIETLEGVMTASDGDYIIQGINGELYPCKPDIFEKTYESCKKGDLDNFQKSVIPLMNYLKENYHPHCTAIVTSEHAEITEGIKSFVNNKY